ncbi:hypothetical protein WDU94_000335, partial [Cyamophila willieti]
MRDPYRPVAKRAVILYLVLKDMACVNHMYQFSLDLFVNKVFSPTFDSGYSKSVPRSAQSIGSVGSITEAAEQSIGIYAEQDEFVELTDRLNFVINTMTEICYKHVCLGLLEKDKVLFSFQIALRVQISENLVTRPEVDFFIRGSDPFPLPYILSYARSVFISYDNPAGGAAESMTSQDTDSVCPAEWLKPRWNYLLKLGEHLRDSLLGTLYKRVNEHLDEWKQWYEAEQPELLPVPEPNLTEFHRVLIVRCLRPDRLQASVAHYVRSVLGDTMTETSAISYELILMKSSSSNPVLFILSPGCNPEHELRNLALTHDKTLVCMALGQGQEQAAVTLIQSSANQGHWLLLSNIHLVPSFTVHLHSILTTALNNASKITHRSSATAVDMSLNFRLFVTTEPRDTFPIRVLQKCLKVCLHLRTGLKNNMHFLYSTLIDSQLLERCEHPLYKDLVYVIALLHSVLLERRKYSKLGWNIPYLFSRADFISSVSTLSTVLNSSIMSSEPGEHLKYLIGEIMYGGRVSNMYDRRVVNIFMEEYIGDFTQDPAEFSFYPDKHERYRIPSTDYQQHIETSLPSHNSAELLGLHSSAETGYLMESAQEIMYGLKNMYPELGSNVKTKHQIVEEMCTSLLTRISPPFDLVHIRKVKARDASNPTLKLMFEELARFNRLLNRVRLTLELLVKGMAGEVSMDDILESQMNRLYCGEVVDEWRSVAPPSTMKLGAWLEHFQQRWEQYKYWIDFGDPLVMWLPGLHYPYSYFTAITQREVIRKEVWCLDRCSIFTEVSKFTQAIDVEEPPPEGAYVNGLYLQ